MKTKSLVLLPAILGMQNAAWAENLNLVPSVTTSYLHTNADTASDETELDSFSLTPSVVATYTSKKLETRVKVEHEILDRKIAFTNSDKPDINNNEAFTTYNYSGNLSVVENLLSLNFFGRQNYQNLNPTDAFFDERFLNLENLSKTQNHSAGFTFASPNAKYVGFSTSGRYAKTESDQQFDTIRELNDSNLYLRASLYSGSDFDYVRWNVNSSFTDTERKAEDDIISRNTRANVYIGLLSNVSLVLTGTTESNDLSDESNESRRFGNDTYGAGLSWSGRAGRRIDITYNRSENENGETRNFVGGDINWPFSNRTSLTANYSRRFFGEAKSLSINHAHKRIRTSVTYNESVTTYSRLVSQPQLLGLLVCPIADTTGENCYVPDSLNYVPTAEEQSSEIIGLLPEISEQVTLTKAMRANIAYDFRKLTISANLSRSELSYLETNREQIEKSGAITGKLQIESKDVDNHRGPSFRVRAQPGFNLG